MFKEKKKFFRGVGSNYPPPSRGVTFRYSPARGVAFRDGALASSQIERVKRQTRALIWCSGLHQHKNAFYIKIIFVNFIIFVISGIEVAYRSKEEGKLYKNYIYNFYIKGVIDIIIYIYMRVRIARK